MLAMTLAAVVLAAAAPAKKRHAPAASAPADAGPAATPGAPFFEPVTKVDGQTLQLVFGARAVFHLNDQGAPVIDKTEKGQLAIAHPVGAATETFEKPDKGQIAIALDGSAEKKASYLKVWNGLDYPIAYRAGVLVLHEGRLVPSTVKVCAVPAGATNYETWPQPVVAIALGSFEKAADEKACK